MPAWLRLRHRVLRPRANSQTYCTFYTVAVTLCQGSVAKWGVDVREAIHYFGRLGRIHHVHYRNPRGTFPRYVEPWLDEGDLNMLQMMQAYRDVDYRLTLRSDHVPQMGDDTAFGHIRRADNHDYIKAMIQAANQLP